MTKSSKSETRPAAKPKAETKPAPKAEVVETKPAAEPAPAKPGRPALHREPAGPAELTIEIRNVYSLTNRTERTIIVDELAGSQRMAQHEVLPGAILLVEAEEGNHFKAFYA